MVDGGRKKAAGVIPAILGLVSRLRACVYVSNYIARAHRYPQFSSCIGVMICPETMEAEEIMRLEGDKPISLTIKRHAPGQVFMAWLLQALVIAVLTKNLR
jgi:hypothetical protein